MSDEIIFFGCWNNGGCDLHSTEPNSLTTMVKGLNEYLSHIEKKPQSLIVAGDNYYPQKNKYKNKDKTKNETKDEKPQKIFKTKEISSGFNCLQEIDIEKKYILLGNHDLEKTIEENNEKDCNAIIYQKYLSDNKSFNFFNFNLDSPRELEMIRISSNTVIIMFDSSIYEKKPEIYLDCYNILRSEETKFESIDDIKQLQINQRDNTIEKLKKSEYSNVTNIVFACHHPLFFLKTKKSNCIFEYSENIINFLLPFNKLKKKFIYLCADLHLFQRSVILIGGIEEQKMKLEHIVIGTGGAELDDDCDYSSLTDIMNEENLKEDSKIHFLDFKFSEIEHLNNDKNKQLISLKNNGFLHCKFSKNKIKMKFVITSSPSSSSLKALSLSPLSSISTSSLLKLKAPPPSRKSSQKIKRRHSIGGNKNIKKTKNYNNRTKKIISKKNITNYSFEELFL
uniref:Calcineurin-like phosphoesterase domain-containing protein n=1 Tax=viral metagenome TaxID=1070528 RepID=A0A6C0HTD7_9ZZZZ